MRFRDKLSGAIYVITTDDVLSMFKNDRYEVVEEKNIEPKDTLDVEKAEEVKDKKKSKKK